MMLRRMPSLRWLFWVVVADYLAQVPYYLVNYYLPHGTAPTPSSLILLGATLAWFLIGYFAYRASRPFGYWVLLSFLLVEGLFYLHTILFGAIAFQLENPSPVIRVVFVIGYLTGLVSLAYFVLLTAFRSRYEPDRHRSTAR